MKVIRYFKEGEPVPHAATFLCIKRILLKTTDGSVKVETIHVYEVLEHDSHVIEIMLDALSKGKYR